MGTSVLLLRFFYRLITLSLTIAVLLLTATVIGHHLFHQKTKKDEGKDVTREDYKTEMWEMISDSFLIRPVEELLFPSSKEWKIVDPSSSSSSSFGIFAWPIWFLQSRSHSIGEFTTVLFSFAALVFSLLEIFCHLCNYNWPVAQRYTIRILWMVPVYVVNSLGGYYVLLLMQNPASVPTFFRENLPAFFQDAERMSSFLCLLRDTYESFVLYNFFHLLMTFCNGEKGAVVMLNPGRKAIDAVKGNYKMMAHGFPMNFFLSPFPLNQKTLSRWKFMLFQYIFLSPFITVLTLFLESTSLYNEDTWSLENPHIYLVIAKSVSVTFSFTALFYFYLAGRHEEPLHQYQPSGKFIAVKLVIFLGFWQGIVLDLLFRFGVLSVDHSITKFLFHHFSRTASAGGITKVHHHPSHLKKILNLSSTELALENMLTCFEMFITACMHSHFFSWTSFCSSAKEEEGSKERTMTSRTSSKKSAGKRSSSFNNNEKSGGKKYGFVGAAFHALSIGDIFEESVKWCGMRNESKSKTE